jgi:hypothetical protein
MIPRPIAIAFLACLFGCGGAAFTLGSPGDPAGPDGAEGDAGDGAVWDTMLDAVARDETFADLAAERPRSSADASADDGFAADADAPVVVALCCHGQEKTVAVSAATCYPLGASLSETCAATGDGGQVCQTTASAPPSTGCADGAPCIESLAAQTLPGTVGPCF